MDTPQPPKRQPTQAEIDAERAIVDLIEDHMQEGVSHDLTHKGLLAEEHPADHDQRHADPLKPDHHFAPDKHQAPKRKFL